MNTPYSNFHYTFYFLTNRVAITPTVAATLIKKGFNLNIEENAGLGAKFRNEDYEKIGAKLVDTKTAFYSGITIFLITLMFLIISNCRYYIESETTYRSRNR